MFGGQLHKKYLLIDKINEYNHNWHFVSFIVTINIRAFGKELWLILYFQYLLHLTEGDDLACIATSLTVKPVSKLFS